MRKQGRDDESLDKEYPNERQAEEIDPNWMFDRQAIQQEEVDIPDDALKEVIRSGLMRGKQRSRNVRRRRLLMRASTAVLSILLLLAVFTRVSPVFASVLKDIPFFNKFVQLIDYDSTLRSAANNEFMQAVQVSDTVNGRTFTVHFIMTDGHRLVLFYSLEGEGITKSSSLSSFKIQGAHGEAIPAGYTTWGAGDEDNSAAGEKFDKVDIRIQPGTTLPDRVVFQTECEQDKFQVEFDIDQSRFATMREQYTVDKVFQIGGQSYHVGNVTVTPLQVEVPIEDMPGNTKKTNGLIELALVDEQGNRWKWDSGSESTIYFYSSYYTRPKHLTLVADGAYQVDTGRKLVIDTDKLQTIETPDERLRLVDTKPSSDGQKLTLTIEIDGMDKIEGVKGYNLFNQSTPFTDAEGHAYYLDGGSGISSLQDTSLDHYKQEITYTIPNKPYKQPLTFELDQYPGYVLQQVKVPIR
ncbi:DUF4179 domain-containing protein [Paenibacillus sp. PR3]|uniref:DUF4179 domain-containing protein n=1 Tax=Paenibacillus terricola TaxID=2763503 RepID=A0ABR8N736_9BACL|nr:DUF4179 domain-containing protein [Paenibacillus terricola]MBD3922664.1 DUF4179 domain-containing protein [Paenibacillus terricola]